MESAKKRRSPPALRLVDTWQGGVWVLYGDDRGENGSGVVGQGNGQG